METRLDHPEVLTDFKAVSSRRARAWVGFCMAIWLLLMVGDWAARFRVFRWQDQWMPAVPSTTLEMAATRKEIPTQQGGGLTQMVPVPWMVDRYAEAHPAYTEYRDAWGYANAPLPEGKAYSIVMLGDSFMLSLGTQNVAQVLASLGGVEVYNHAKRGAGPFLEMRRFIGSDFFDPPPKVVIWNLTARELGASLFLRQAVEYWFEQAGTASPGLALSGHGIRWDLLAPSELRKSWPNTSVAAFFSRRFWGQMKLAVFHGWPRDVLGAEDPVFGPMLFYRENLRVLPLLHPDPDAPAIVQTVAKVADGFKAWGMDLVVLLVPEKEQIHARALSPEDQQALADGPALLAAIEAGLKQEGIPVVNLMPRFQATTDQGTRLYWRDDTHWNDVGIRIAAEELWQVTEPLLK